jgi:hypothetical protein
MNAGRSWRDGGDVPARVAARVRSLEAEVMATIRPYETYILTGASPSALEMVCTSVCDQSWPGDWGVRGPGMKVRPDLEKVPCCT